MIRSIPFCLIILCLMACTPKPESTTEPVPEPVTEVPLPDFGKHRTVGLVVVDGVYNSELMAPYDLFHHTVFHTDPGMKVFTVAPSLETITSFEGIRLLPDFTFDRCPPIDVLVVPSALHSMDTDLENEVLINFVRERGEQAEYILSLCDGAFVFAQAGLLDSVACTTFPGDIEAFKTRFPQLDVRSGLSFVHDGKAITSAGGARSYDPAMYLIHLLYGEQVTKGVAKGMVLSWSTEQYEAATSLSVPQE